MAASLLLLQPGFACMVAWNLHLMHGANSCVGSAVVTWLLSVMFMFQPAGLKMSETCCDLFIKPVNGSKLMSCVWLLLFVKTRVNVCVCTVVWVWLWGPVWLSDHRCEDVAALSGRDARTSHLPRAVWGFWPDFRFQVRGCTMSVRILTTVQSCLLKKVGEISSFRNMHGVCAYTDAHRA